MLLDPRSSLPHARFIVLGGDQGEEIERIVQARGGELGRAFVVPGCCLVLALVVRRRWAVAEPTSGCDRTGSCGRRRAFLLPCGLSCWFGFDDSYGSFLLGLYEDDLSKSQQVDSRSDASLTSSRAFSAFRAASAAFLASLSTSFAFFPLAPSSHD